MSFDEFPKHHPEIAESPLAMQPASQESLQSLLDIAQTSPRHWLDAARAQKQYSCERLKPDEVTNWLGAIARFQKFPMLPKGTVQLVNYDVFAIPDGLGIRKGVGITLVGLMDVFADSGTCSGDESDATEAVDTDVFNTESLAKRAYEELFGPNADLDLIARIEAEAKMESDFFADFVSEAEALEIIKDFA